MSIDPDLEWRPGRLGRLRAGVRRALRAILGPRGEGAFHRWYHHLLRATGRFGPPEGPGTAATLEAIAARSMTIMDIGANVGRYSWFLRRRAPAQARLFALEPHPGAATLVRAAIEGLRGCTVLEIGASDVDGTARLMVPDGSFGSPVSGLAWIDANGQAGDSDGPVVGIRRLDGLVDDGTIEIDGPVFIKIDVEGGEPRVLRGAAGLLRKHRPIVYFECQATSLARQGETPWVVWDQLRQAGYRMYANRSGRFEPAEDVDPSIVNYLAIPDVPTDGPIDVTAIDGLLDAWAARSSRG